MVVSAVGGLKPDTEDLLERRSRVCCLSLPRKESNAVPSLWFSRALR
jgi:hypothetical protein